MWNVKNKLSFYCAFRLNNTTQTVLYKMNGEINENRMNDLIDVFRADEKLWSRLIFLTEHISQQGKYPNYGSMLEEIQGKILDEILHVRQRQDNAIECLRQLYAAHVHCLTQITLLKEENERLQILHQNTVQVSF